MSYSIVCDALSFEWPDGTPVLTGLDVAFGPGRTGLIGVNGSGKSTLLRLIAGELRPASGSVSVAGEIGYLPQNLAAGHRPHGRRPARHHRTARRAARHRERRRRRGALHRARRRLGRRGARPRRARTGSASATSTWTAPSASCPAARSSWSAWPPCSLRRPDVLLLDEPTNNLDLDATTAAVRGRRVLDRGAGGGQPRPRTARPGGPDRRPARGRRPDVRRQPVGVRGDARGRAGGRGADGPCRRGRPQAAETRTGGGPDQAGPPRPLRQEDVRDQARAEDHHAGAQAAGAGVGGQAPQHARGAARTRPRSGSPRRERPSATTPRSGSTCRTPRSPPAAPCSPCRESGTCTSYAAVRTRKASRSRS